MNFRYVILTTLLATGCAPTMAPSKTGAEAEADLVFADQDRLRVKVDEETGMRMYSVVPDLEVSRQGKLSMASVLLAPRAKGASGELGFQTTSKFVRYRDCNNLQLVLDGRALPRKQLRYFGSLVRGFVVEAVVAPLSTDELERVVAARRVEYRLCDTRGSLSSRDRDLLGRMMARWQERK